MAGRRALPGRLRPTHVNLVLKGLLGTALVTGLLAWAVAEPWSGWLARVHGVVGLSLLVLTPAKLRGPVRAGFRRHRWSRWVSAGFGVVVLATVAFGVLHTTGLWYGVGTWSALWTHTLLGLVAVGLLLWHLTTRPVRARAVDLDRQALLRLGLVLGIGLGIYLAQETATRVTGLGRGRRATGSREIASGDPDRMPQVIWLDDVVPDDTAAADWLVRVDGSDVSVDALWERARPFTAVLDCTGGWWSEQAWDAVALSDLLGRADVGRGVRVRSATGYTRIVSPDDLAEVHLAVGYGGAPLRAGHGGPVRLVVPGRRGPWWVKWVVEVQPVGQPSWLQPPLPLT